MKFTWFARRQALRRAVGHAWIVLALLLAPTAAHSTTAEESYVESAQEYYQEGDLPAALIELKNALQDNPDNAAARALLGKVHLDRKDFARAEKELSRAWDLGVRTEELKLLLVRARLGVGDFSGALQLTDVISGVDPASSQHQLALRGEALLALGRTEEASKAFQDVLKVKPVARAYAGLARLAFMNGRMEEAIAFTSKAREVDPDNADMHALAGNILSASGRTSEAIAAMSRALELDPGNVAALVGMTTQDLVAKNYESAKDHVDRALMAGDSTVPIVVLKAYVELALQDYSVARALAESILAVDSVNVAALYIAGVAAFGLNETEQARSRLTQYLSRVPEDRHARAIVDHLATVPDSSPTSQQGHTSEADDTRSTLLGILSSRALTGGLAQTGQRNLETWAMQSVDNSRLRAQLSISKSQSGDLSRAEEELSEAIRLDKDGQFVNEIDQAEVALILSHIHKQSFGRAIELATAFANRRPDQATPNTLLSLAYAKQGDSAKALDAMEKARKTSPDAPELTSNYAALQALLGDIAGALATLQASVAKHEGHYPTLLQLASLSLRAQDLDNAISWADKARTVMPNAPEPRIILARAYNAQRRYEEALESTEEMAQGNSGNVPLLEAIGEAQFNLGRAADAVKTYEALANAAPYSGGAYFYLARSYMETNRHDLVLPTLRKALAIDPENYSARVAYARVMLAKGDTKQVTPLVDSLTKQFGANPEIQELVGQLALANGDYDGAIAQLTGAGNGFAKQGVYRRSVTEGLVSAFRRQGNKERALAEMEGWLTRNPNDSAMRLQLASVQASSGKIAAALEEYERVIEAEPANWVARNDIAMLLFGQGDHGAAREQAEIAYKQASDNPAVMDTLGIILLADRRPAEALPLLTKANAAAPHHPEIALHLCEAYKQSGKSGEAVPAMEQVMAGLGQVKGRDAVEQCYRSLVE
jgi:putative PEP-CTERM system TPR-repeat lipoprotein